MANTKISQAYPKATLAVTDMIPVAAQGQLTAYHVTGQAIFDSLPAGTTASLGVVELATAAEAKAGVDTERALTPASLIGAIGKTMIAEGLHYIGDVDPLTALQIKTVFEAALGRTWEHGDIMIFDGPYPGYGFFFGIYHKPAGKVYCFNMRDGTFTYFS
jgi:hypothetical protein